MLIFSFSCSDDEDESIRNLISPRKRPKSLIAQLAEGRKAQKSIYSFGPAAAINVPVKTSAPSLGSRSSENPDLLGSILASQSQLTTFGKSAEVIRPKPRNTNSNRVLGAILASQATLSRLDETIRCQEQKNQTACPSGNILKPILAQKPARTGNVSQNDSTGQGSSSSPNQQTSSGASSKGESSSSTSGSDSIGTRTNGQSSGEATANGNGISGGDDGNGEDPNQGRKKKSQPEDKKDDVDEEDVDLYSDIESVEDENDPPDVLPKIEVSLLFLMVASMTLYKIQLHRLKKIESLRRKMTRRD